MYFCDVDDLAGLFSQAHCGRAELIFQRLDWEPKNFVNEMTATAVPKPWKNSVSS